MMFALTTSFADSALDQKNGERFVGIENHLGNTNMLPGLYSVAVTQAVSMRTLLAYGSAAVALGPKLGILTPP